ncbi:hypothetical protein HZA97_00820 [Candidatus Woesearchaeota archaeon]|nr:hypothetical protein [Candidatus Woesearchaeota archaeon]
MSKMGTKELFQVANNLKAYRAALNALDENRSPQYLSEYYVDNESSPVPLRYYLKKYLKGDLRKEDVKSRLEELTTAWTEYSKELEK